MIFFEGNRVYVSEELYYTVFRIKNRVILAPCEELKKKQRYMKRAINWTFPLKIDTLKSAQIHTGKKWVLKMDIKDFYGSVPYEAIRCVIEKVSERVKNVEVNQYLRYTTVEHKLPTGAPTSAHIANACFYPLDRRIGTYCRNFGINYSRYMDDMTFSCDDKMYLNMIEKYVTKVLDMAGFKVNPKKTKYISSNRQQNVLGVVVNNETATIPKKLKRRIRAMLHSYYLFMHHSTSIGMKHRVWDAKKIAELNGYLAYVKKMDPEYYLKLRKYYKDKIIV